MNSETIMDKRIFELQADICKIFAHPKRLELLCLLKQGEQSFGDLQDALEVSKANLSQHLTILRERGVLTVRRDGQHLFFSIANPKITEACTIMHEFMCEQIKDRSAMTDGE